MPAKEHSPSESSERRLVLIRVFEAPRALVYEMWTKPEHLAHWSCPKGYTIVHQNGDCRPGGKWRSCMRSPDGKDLWLGGVYRELVRDQRLVFTHVWDQADGEPGHETVVTVLLENHARGTKMTFQQELFDSKANRDGHADGWTQCFDRLDGHLKSAA